MHSNDANLSMTSASFFTICVSVQRMAANNLSNSTVFVSCINAVTVKASFGLAEAITWSLMSFITVAGGALSIAKVLKDFHRAPDHNVYLISLLSSDLCIGAVAHPIFAIAVYELNLPCTLAKTIGSIAYLNILVSFSSSLALAAHRNRTLNTRNTRPLNWMQRKARYPKKALFVVSCIWLCSVPLAAARALMDSNRFFRLLIGILCIAIIGTNCRLLIKLRKMKARVHTISNVRTASQKKQKLATWVINGLTLSLVMTYIPSIIVGILKGTKTLVTHEAIAFSSKVVFLGPVIDPIIYVALSHFLQ